MLQETGAEIEFLRLLFEGFPKGEDRVDKMMVLGMYKCFVYAVFGGFRACGPKDRAARV